MNIRADCIITPNICMFSCARVLENSACEFEFKFSLPMQSAPRRLIGENWELRRDPEYGRRGSRRRLNTSAPLPESGGGGGGGGAAAEVADSTARSCDGLELEIRYDLRY